MLVKDFFGIQEIKNTLKFFVREISKQLRGFFVGQANEVRTSWTF